MEFGFEFWTGIPLFWAVATVRALAKGDVWINRVGFGNGWGQERFWVDWMIRN